MVLKSTHIHTLFKGGGEKVQIILSMCKNSRRKNNRVDMVATMN